MPLVQCGLRETGAAGIRQGWSGPPLPVLSYRTAKLRTAVCDGNADASARISAMTGYPPKTRRSRRPDSTLTLLSGASSTGNDWNARKRWARGTEAPDVGLRGGKRGRSDSLAGIEDVQGIERVLDRMLYLE